MVTEGQMPFYLHCHDMKRMNVFVMGLGNIKVDTGLLEVARLATLETES
jgi:hypothetical protein